MTTLTGHKFVEQSAQNAEYQKLFKGHEGAIELHPGAWTVPRPFKKYADDISKFEYEENDVIVMTVPKSGTTWTQEIVWTMKNNANLNNPMAQLPLNIRTPIVEIDVIIDHMEARGTFVEMFKQQFPDFDMSHGMFLHLAKMSPKPRVLKSHLPYQLLSKTALDKAKTVYTIRDPRDLCISYFHHSQMFLYEGYNGTFEEYVDVFIAGAMWLGPYWEHVAQAWKLRDHPNLHIMFYEKMKKNPKQEYTKLGKFLGAEISDAQMDKIIVHTSFAEMKKRDNHVVGQADAPAMMNMELTKKTGGFFRQGTSGCWKKILTQEQKDKFQKWIDEKCPDKEIMNNILNA